MGNWRERLPWPVEVNDIHSKLNATTVQRVLRPRSGAQATGIVRQAVESGQRIALCGGRHSMGGQQFLSDALLIDTRKLDSLYDLDTQSGIASVGAGIQWPALYKDLQRAQPGNPFGWTYRQKQTGGDRLTLGGSIASNIHSRGLAMKPLVEDIESLELVLPTGELIQVSREENSELWPLVHGGYGLFGLVTSVRLRLTRRHKMRRRVALRGVEGLMEAFDERIAQGFEFGDFQFTIDDKADDFMRRGVFACYEPVEDSTPIPDDQKGVPARAWHYLVHLAHTEKSRAFQLYADFYEKTDGQIYWSDLHQMTLYLDDYHKRYDRRIRASCPGSEMITELYVPREKLEEFLAAARTELKRLRANVIYGTIRLIEKDTETFLPWASQNWACVIFNLHVDHDPEGLALAKDQFRTLIDIAQGLGGSFYLTYHRWATREQILRSYPQMPEFLRLKRKWDPDGVLSSEWHSHMESLFAEQ